MRPQALLQSNVGFQRPKHYITSNRQKHHIIAKIPKHHRRAKTQNHYSTASRQNTTKAPQQSDNRKQHHSKSKRQTHHSKANRQKHHSMGDARRLKHEGCLRRCHAGVTPHSAPRAWRLARRGEAFGMCPLLQSTGSPLLKNSGRRCRRKTRRSKTVADQGGSGALNNPMARTRQNGRSA